MEAASIIIRVILGIKVFMLLMMLLMASGAASMVTAREVPGLVAISAYVLVAGFVILKLKGREAPPALYAVGAALCFFPFNWFTKLA